MTLRIAPSNARLATLALALPLSFVAIAGTSCQSTGRSTSDAGKPAQPQARLSQLVPSEWTCTQLEKHAFSEGAVPTMAFAGTDGDSGSVQVSGRAGVNRYFGPVKQTDGGLAFGPLAATRMGGSPERMELERAYLDMLAKADAAWIDGDTLRLVDDGVVLATFTRSKP